MYVQYYLRDIMNQLRTPLTTEQLVEIRIRSDSPDMRAVLWEIRRMRAVISRADQLERSLGRTGGEIGLIRELLRMQLDEEPSIKEFIRFELSPR